MAFPLLLNQPAAELLGQPLDALEVAAPAPGRLQLDRAGVGDRLAEELAPRPQLGRAEPAGVLGRQRVPDLGQDALDAQRVAGDRLLELRAEVGDLLPERADLGQGVGVLAQLAASVSVGSLSSSRSPRMRSSRCRRSAQTARTERLPLTTSKP